MAKLTPFLLLLLRSQRRQLTLKNALLFLLFTAGTLGLYAYTLRDAFIIGILFLLLFFTITAVGIPFTLGEVNSSDQIFALLPLPAKTVVLGRYLFTLGATLLCGLYLFLAALATNTLADLAFTLPQLYLATNAALLLSCLLQAAIIVTCFRYGYQRHMSLAAVLFFVLLLWGAGFLFMNPYLLDLFYFLQAHPVTVGTYCLVAAPVIFFLSAPLSYFCYQKRGF